MSAGYRGNSMIKSSRPVMRASLLLGDMNHTLSKTFGQPARKAGKNERSEEGTT